MKKWSFYSTKEIAPAGWLKRQLELQAEGLSGNLDKIWPDIKDSGWIGGAREGWERVPYWLDGFIPLAYLLENKDMMQRAEKYIRAIITHQQPDGWICPCSQEERKTYDTWAVLLMTKVLTVYYECTGDESVLTVVYATLKNFYQLLKDNAIQLIRWGKYRWFEGFVAINLLHRKYSEPWIVDLAKILKKQGFDYHQAMPLWKTPLNHWKLETHVVNIAMMLKSQALSNDILKEEDTQSAEQWYQALYQYNGTPVGLFTGDECLSGQSPIQGTELCAVVEQMYSYEHLYAYTGQDKWMERLELAAFNALPATLSDDMWAHQYVQMTNQMACQEFPGKAVFRTNGKDAHLFGLEPHYGCCTANFSQGWPKFALSTFMHRDDTIVNAIPVPSVLETEDIYISLETNYPFQTSFQYTIASKKDFHFEVRIPSFAQNLTVNGEKQAAKHQKFTIKANTKTQISINYTVTPALEKRPHDLNVVKYGSLIFAVPIAYEKQMHEYVKDGVTRKFPYCDYQYIPKSHWSYAYCQGELAVENHPIGETPFSSQNPPITIAAKVKKIQWGLEDGYETVCAKTPLSREPIGQMEEIQLYPYGCAKLRMTELPLLE